MKEKIKSTILEILLMMAIIIFAIFLINIFNMSTEITAQTATEKTAEETTTAETTGFLYTAEFYNSLAEENQLFNVYDSAELTEEILTERNGALIIEKCYGVVTDNNGNGRILLNDNDFINAHDRNYNNIADNYISYKSVTGTGEGDIILTYFIYNPNSNYIDDITERFDYIIDDKSN
jgi:hypothetical protein